MYNLGEQFKIDYETVMPNQEAILQGQKYRFTVLSERLIRIEYRENGVFNDELTELVRNRNFPKPKFEIKEDRNYLELTTPYFKLFYANETKINNSKNFYVQVLNTDRSWHYNHVEAKNYSAPVLIEKGKIENTKSLYSLDGFVSIDDSKGKIVTPEGIIKENTYEGIGAGRT